MTSDEPRTYFVAIDGRTYGPATREELRNWFLAGSFRPTDFIWSEEKQEWLPAASHPDLSTLFDLPPPPTEGIQDAEELPPHFRVTREPSATESRCRNHEDAAAVALCPQCGHPYCAECVGTLEGMTLCLDCIGAEKARQAVRTVRPNRLYGFALAFTALLLLVGILTFFLSGPRPPEQPDPPPRVKIERTPLSIPAPTPAGQE